MININTAYRDPTDPCNPGANWDGSLLTHINLDTDRNVHDPSGIYYGFMADGDDLAGLSTAQLQLARCGAAPAGDLAYHNNVARRLLNPVTGYLPFDIGDELEFRNRFFLSTTYIPPGVVTRSGLVWPVTFDPQAHPGRGTPFGTEPGDNIANWFEKVTSPEIPTDPCDTKRFCNRRHISTTYSFDRILRPYDDTPLPGDMLDAFELDTFRQRKFGIRLPPTIADGSATQAEIEQYIRQLAGAIYRGLPGDAEIADRFGAEYTREKIAWQFAVNLIDYQDDDHVIGNPDDDEPTYYAVADGSGLEFWGVENVECIKRDTIFVSEVGYLNDPCRTPPEYYAIELFNPTAQKDLTVNDYQVVIDNYTPISLYSLSLPEDVFPTGDVVVLTNDKTNALDVFAGSILNDPTKIFEVTGLTFEYEDEIVVYKEDWPTSGADMPVDRTKVPAEIVLADGVVHIQERNQTLGLTADNLLWTDLWTDTGELGTAPSLIESDPNMHVQLAVTNEPMRTIGEIENVFAVGYDPNDHTLIGDIWTCTWLDSITELGLDMRRYGRINLADPNYWGLLDFLTYFDPSNDGVDNNGDGQPDEPTELAIAGRININTAPWFVIKQLPWVGLTSGGGDIDNLAQAIVAWRDMLSLASIGGPNYSNRSENPGFTSTGQLLQVINTSGASEFDIRKYLDSAPLNGAPDFSSDTTDGDFEERDIIFQRISNLVTVRSDVFTAYILVRVGHGGPQKRMIAIFDRSNVYLPTDRPRLVALHPVPDPR
jgi:hypothetical protein